MSKINSYSLSDISIALKNLSIQEGDTVLFTGQLFSAGVMQGVVDRETFLQGWLNSIFDVIGDDGTLSVLTYTTQTARFSKPYYHEKTKPMNGIFSEFLLKQKGAVRSLHPIYSVTSLGKNSDFISKDNSPSSYGLCSPFDRLLKKNAKLVTLGIPYANNAFLHHIEHMIGVPYCYNKLLDIDVYVNDEKFDKHFFSNVRYLDLDIHHDLEKIKSKLNENRSVLSAHIGSADIAAIDANEYCAILSNLIVDEPFGLLKGIPNFRKGKIPFDGATMGRDGIEAGNFSYFGSNEDN